MGAGTLHLEGTNASIAIGDSTTFGTKGIQLEYNETGDGENPEVFTGQPQFYAGNGSNDYVKYTTDGGLEIGGTVSAISTDNTDYTITMGSVSVPAESTSPLVLFSSNGSSYPFWVDSAGDFSFGGGGLSYSGNEIVLKSVSGNTVATIGQEADDSLFNITQYAGGERMFSVRYATESIDHDIFNIQSTFRNKGVTGLRVMLSGGADDGETTKENLGADYSILASYFGSVTSQYGTRSSVIGGKYNYGSHNTISMSDVAADKDSNVAVYGRAAQIYGPAAKYGWAGYFEGGVKITGPTELTHNAWVSVTTFLGTWVNYGGQTQTVRYRKTPDGMVEIEGVLTGGSDGALFTLPPDYYSASYQRFAAISSNNTLASIIINTSGTVYVSNSDSTFLSVSGIRYYVGH